MKIQGIGVVLRAQMGTYLFQERDYNTVRDPGMMVPFGGALEAGESPLQCAERELQEELELEVDSLEEVGVFESHNRPGQYIQIFLAENIQPEKLVLHEGAAIAELAHEEALAHEKVTAFTKEVLQSLQKKPVV